MSRVPRSQHAEHSLSIAWTTPSVPYVRAYKNGRPIPTPLAPRHTAFTTSVPRLMPPETEKSGSDESGSSSTPARTVDVDLASLVLDDFRVELVQFEEGVQRRWRTIKSSPALRGSSRSVSDFHPARIQAYLPVIAEIHRINAQIIRLLDVLLMCAVSAPRPVRANLFALTHLHGLNSLQPYGKLRVLA
jgi:hypothetical protein